MTRNLVVGLPTILICLLLQAFFLGIVLRHYARWKLRPKKLGDVALLSTVMLVVLMGNFAQMSIWAMLFRLLGEFKDFETALYFSGITFATLGYGDIILSERWRLLSALEAANGILMFGVSTAALTGMIIEIIRSHAARHGKSNDTA